MRQSVGFNDLLALYEQLEAEGALPQERREHPRSAPKGQVSAVLEVPGGVPMAVLVRDMSRSGIGVYSPNSIRVGERVGVSFRLSARAVRATCRVASCREDHDGRWVVGLAFVEVTKSADGAGAEPAVETTGALEGEGQMVSAKEAMQGAELGHVEDVIRRISGALKG